MKTFFKSLVSVFIWLGYVFFYFLLGGLGFILSGFIVLYTMRKLVGWTDDKGSPHFSTIGQYPTWAWPWVPYGQACVYNDKEYLSQYPFRANEDPFQMFIRRWRYFLSSKETNLNTVLLGKISSGPLKITRRGNHYYSLVLMKDMNLNWRLVLIVRVRRLLKIKTSLFMLDCGWRLTSNHKVANKAYRARLLCRILPIQKDF